MIVLILIYKLIFIYINHVTQSGNNFYEGIEDMKKYVEKVKEYRHKKSCILVFYGPE